MAFCYSNLNKTCRESHSNREEKHQDDFKRFPQTDEDRDNSLVYENEFV